MPPKKASSSASVGRPRSAVSDDPALELKRQKQRESAAKYRAKRKATSANNIPLGQSQSQSYMGSSEASQNSTALAMSSHIMNNDKEMRQSEASSLIGKAIKNKLARTKVAELKYDRAMDTDKGATTDIEIPYKDAKKFFSKDKRMMKYMNMNLGSNPAEEEGISITYKPFSTYDYFEYNYYDQSKANNSSSSANKIYRTKIPRSRDVDYSDYLYNKFVKKSEEIYKGGKGSGNIRGEGSSGAASANKSSVGAKSSMSSSKSSASSSKSSSVSGLRRAKSGLSAVSSTSSSGTSSSMKNFRKKYPNGYQSSASSMEDRTAYRSSNSMTNSG